jgi:hypothetical protein
VDALCLFAGVYTAGRILVRARGGPPVAPWARTFFRVQALLFAAAGLLLLVAPGAMADVWPWPVGEGLARFYGVAFLTYAYCSRRYAGRRSLAEVAAIAPAMQAFSAVTLLVSQEHGDLFSKADAAAWLWFAGFGVACAALLVINARALPAAAQRSQTSMRSVGAPSG